MRERKQERFILMVTSRPLGRGSLMPVTVFELLLNLIWEDVLVNKILARQAQGPEFVYVCLFKAGISFFKV